jgi:phosphoribosyl-ATP pyrophosphohydrolase
MKSFNDLYLELSQKAGSGDLSSSSVQLLERGTHEIGKKIVEEAAELWMAAEHESDDQVALEASQLLYYIQLVLIARGVPLSKVEEVL